MWGSRGRVVCVRKLYMSEVGDSDRDECEVDTPSKPSSKNISAVLIRICNITALSQRDVLSMFVGQHTAEN